MADDIETKFSAARTRLILDQPFFGALVLRLPLVAADPSWCPTTATDMKSLYYNPEYISALGVKHVEFVLTHEALHCALAHFMRCGHRDRRRWDLACDFAINPLLLAEGFTPPSNVVTFLEYAGMTAEEIYPLLQDNENEQTMDRHLYGHADSDPSNASSTQTQPPPLSHDEQDALGQQWQDHLAGAAQRAAQAGKLSGALAKWVDTLLQPKLSWRALLAQFLVERARDDYSYMRPSRREGEAILPSLRSGEIDIAVVIDTSGSISELEMREFFGEINAIKSNARARVTLLACDTELSADSPRVFEVWDEVSLPQLLQRGGGTNFLPPFHWLNEQDRAPDLLVYFTDACGEFPSAPPNCPVVWLVKGKAPVPWGQRIQLT